MLATVTGIFLVAALLAPVPRIDGTAYGVQCLPDGSIDTVDQLDTFVSQVLDTPQWQGGDVGASVELLDGRHLFVFADTLRVTPLAGPLTRAPRTRTATSVWCGTPCWCWTTGAPRSWSPGTTAR